MADTAGEMRIFAKDLKHYTIELLKKVGVPEDEGQMVADVLVEADLRGVDSHGVARLSNYVEAIEKGYITPKAKVTVKSEWPAIALIDGGDSLGQVVGVQAMNKCMDMAEKAGMATITVTNSRHYGIAGYYAMMALKRDMIGLSLTNSRPWVAPTFGAKAVLGTNPIAMAVPAGKERPWVLDMATSAIPIGKVEVAQRLNKQLRDGVAIDNTGAVTRTPEDVYKGGALLPLGGMAETAGYKGYGLSVLVDILSGVLSGASYSAKISNVWGVSAIGHFFMAMRIDAVRPVAEFKAMMDEMIVALRESPKATGESRIIIAGEPEFTPRRAAPRKASCSWPRWGRPCAPWASGWAWRGFSRTPNLCHQACDA
jgi:L-2-hydroxycarboxylate dehydrogenase (NAD+)